MVVVVVGVEADGGALVVVVAPGRVVASTATLGHCTVAGVEVAQFRFGARTAEVA